MEAYEQTVIPAQAARMKSFEEVKEATQKQQVEDRQRREQQQQEEMFRKQQEAISQREAENKARQEAELHQRQQNERKEQELLFRRQIEAEEQRARYCRGHIHDKDEGTRCIDSRWDAAPCHVLFGITHATEHSTIVILMLILISFGMIQCSLHHWSWTIG